MEREHEAGLLARAASGDAEAFRKLFDGHHAAMFRFAYRLTGAVDAAEDITQECFLRLVQQRAFDPERGSLRQYLYGMVRNLVRQRLQSNGREVHWDDNVEDDPKSAVLACPDVMASAELTAIVQMAISALPPLQREAIVLSEFEELSLDEVATIVGADLGTVKSRLHRAREGLRRTLSAYRNHVRMPLPKGTTP